MDIFKGRNLVIATKHKKEAVIAPLLEKDLGVTCFVPDDFDSDAFGTFSGEIKRIGNALETARQKCLRAMELTNCDLGIASEGSFGMHPTIFMAAADDEILIFIDKKNKLEFYVRELSMETNFYSGTAATYEQVENLVKKVGFPEHAVLLKISTPDGTSVVKGIQSWELLEASFRSLSAKNIPVVVETDMRALFNPTRMNVIAKATQKLVEKIKSLCPKCDTPGFGVVNYKTGLPCAWCNQPTASTLAHILKCQKCLFEKVRFYPFEKKTEDPMYCDYCNP